MMDIFISFVDLFIQQTFTEFTYVGAEEWEGCGLTEGGLNGAVGGCPMLSWNRDKLRKCFLSHGKKRRLYVAGKGELLRSFNQIEGGAGWPLCGGYAGEDTVWKQEGPLDPLQ